MTTATKFEIGQKVANEGGAWVRLRTYPHTSNLYSVYGFEHWAPSFDADIDRAESVTHMSRAKIERQMTNWLRNR